MSINFCRFCTEQEFCSYEEKLKEKKCKRFEGNSDFTLKIKIKRFLYFKRYNFKKRGR